MTAPNEQQILYPHSLYPALLKTEAETLQMIDNALNNSRIVEMKNQRGILQKDLKRYTKLKRRWKKFDLALKISGITIIGLTGITTAIVGTISAPLMIPLFVPLLPMGMGIIGAVETTIFSGIIMGLTTKKKKFYDEKCKLIQSYLDKLFYYIEQARQDKIITMDELQGFRAIMDDYRIKVDGIEGNPEIDRDLFKQATKEAEKDIKKLIKKKLKDEIVQSKLQ